MDERQNKRYQLRIAVKFSWESSQGSMSQGEGYTRDISPSGIFVLTGDRLPLGATVKLEVALPSPRKEASGAYLRTRGHVVRSEQFGFAAVAEMGFRMQFPDTRSTPSTSGNSGDHEEEHRARSKEVSDATSSRFWT
jgi:PilZ domain